MKTRRVKFSDIVVGEEGLLKGPFGSDLKKSLYVPKSDSTYKVYLQANILQRDKSRGEHHISKEYYESKMTRYTVKNGDFIVTCDGTLGEIFQLNDIIEKGIISSSLLRITLDKDQIDETFFPYFWQQRIKVPLIRSHDNSVLKHLPGVKAIREFEMDLPDLLVQKKIAKVLSDLDAKIELNNKINAELEAMAKLIYDYWFVQFDFPDENGKPYKSSGGKMVYNEELKREIPEGWEVKELGSCIDIQRGISYKSSEIKGGGIPMINLNSFNLNGTYKPEGIKEFSGNYASKNLIDAGDLLIAATDVTRNADIIGKAIMVPEYYSDLVMSMDIAKVIPNDDLTESYLMMLFNSNHYHNYIRWYANGTLVLHLKMDGIKWYKAEIPPIKLLNEFDSIFKPISGRINETSLQNKKLAELRDWLLPMLMNGQVTVN